MNKIWLILSLFLIIKLIISKPISRKKLLYIVLDGFRYDYIDDEVPENIPGFTKFLQNGVRAEYMSTIFPSLSYASWTTLMTGLWAESHGIVGNHFYDPIDKDYFSLYDYKTTGKEKWWKNAEPIWTTATKANLSTAVVKFARCDIPFDGVVPKYCEPYVSIKGPERFQRDTDTALNMLLEGYEFIILFNPHIDNVGHDYGAESEERKDAVRELDKTILHMMDRIQQMGMTDEVNIIMVSDHGMVTTAPGTVRRVELDDYLLTDAVEIVVDGGAFANIKVKPGRVQEVYDKLKGMPGVNVYLHKDIPEEFHYKNNKYIHDIILNANISTIFMKSRSDIQFPPRNYDYVFNGSHGFSPYEEKMRSIFFAKGPDFRTNHAIDAIQSVDVYPLLAKLLKINPRPNNGTLNSFQKALAT